MDDDKIRIRWDELDSPTQTSKNIHVATAATTNSSPPSPPPPPVGSLPPQFTSKPLGADKKIPAGLCGIFLGQLGIHKFILGYTNEAIIMLVVTICCIPVGFLTCGIGFLGIGVMHVIGLIEGIIYMTKSDDEFVATYILNKKGWF